MYRQYEDPYVLQEQLDKVKEEFNKRKELGELEPYDYEDYAMEIADLEERINFAWQDDEYESNYARENGYYDDDVYGNETTDGEPVKAGKIYDLITRALGLFDKLIDKLSDFGEVGERKGGEIYIDFLMSSAENAENLGDDSSKWPDSDTVRVKVQFESGEQGKSDVINVYMKLRDKPDTSGFVKKNIKVEYSNPSDKKKCFEELSKVIDSVLSDEAIVKLFGDRSALDVGNLKTVKSAPVNSSMKVTLQKIVANDIADVNLISIQSPYDVDQTQETLGNIVDDPDFFEALPENEPVSYDITIDSDGYTVDECECCCVDMSDCILKVLQPIYRMYFDCMYLTWNATGSNYQQIVVSAESYMWALKGLIDQLSIDHYKEFGYAPHPLMFCGEMPYDDATKSPIDILQTDMMSLMDTIELYYCNFEGLTQECLLSAKDMFDTECRYTIERFR